MNARAYDAVVIGAGLGGLLAAGAIARRGGSVLVLERLRYLGGRFTTVDQDGYAMTTGALHMAPHGAGGPLARAVRDLGLPFDIVPRDLMASFYYRGQHVLWRRPWDVLKLFSWQGRVDMMKITSWLTLPGGTSRFDAQPFAQWLAGQTSDRAIQHFFESFVQFAVGTTGAELSFGELKAIHQNVLRYGMPGTPVGGCRGVISALTELIGGHGGEIRTHSEVLRIVGGARVEGVAVRDRRSRSVAAVEAPMVVSDVGPEATRTLLGAAGSKVLAADTALPKAAGMKLHIVSDRSMIPHNGVVLCLDTRRVSGMVEVSRAVPGVVPAGQHMIDTFQVMGSDDVVAERDLALMDLRDMFGPSFDEHSRVLRTSAFRSTWPVNHARQGFDLCDQEPVPGLLMVGDAYKPRGHIMVEGVAASVERVLDSLVLT